MPVLRVDVSLKRLFAVEKTPAPGPIAKKFPMVQFIPRDKKPAGKVGPLRFWE